MIFLLFANVRVCGLKYRGARMQPLTRSPEADETKTMTVACPHHACVPLSKRRQHHLARSTGSTCAAASNVRSSPLGADTVCKSGNSFADALFKQGLMALDGAADHLLCEGAVCTRVCDRVLRRCHAAPKRCGSELPSKSSDQLATQAHPSQPHSRLMMPVHMGGRLADSG